MTEWEGRVTKFARETGDLFLMLLAPALRFTTLVGW